MWHQRLGLALVLLASCGCSIARADEPQSTAPANSLSPDAAASLSRLEALVAGDAPAAATRHDKASESFQAFAIGDDLKLGPSKKANAGGDIPPAATDGSAKKAPAPKSKPGKSAAAKRPAGPQRKPVALSLKIAPGADAEQAWTDYFTKHEDVPPADVRETICQLVAKKKFDAAESIIRGALRAGQAQSWMYEALALVMQAGGKPKAEIERVLMSACDFAENVLDLMYAAQYLARTGMEKRAIQVFRQATTLDPTRPEPFVHGLQLAQRLDDPEGIEWASLGVLSQAWPRDKRELEQTAYLAAQALIEDLRSEQKTKEAAELKAKLDRALVRDCLVKVEWTGDADVDIYVEEPSGTICSFRNPRTTSGGVMLGDSVSADGKAGAPSTSSETYVCPQAFSGNYRILLRRVWGKVTAGTVTVSVFTHYGSKNVKHYVHQIPLGDQDTLATFALDEGRRSEPLVEQQVANAAASQIAVSQAIVNQQLNYYASNSGADDDLAKSRSGLVGEFPLQQSVGYQPVIQVLPAGANAMATGVISADRRYVRVTVLPFFSQIGMVTTFNISSGSVGTSPTPPSGGGGVGGGTNGFPPASSGSGT